MKYFKNYIQNIEPSKKLSIGWFLVNCFRIICESFYILKKTFPMFKCDNFEHMHSGDKNNCDDMVNRMRAEKKSEKERIALINALKSYSKTK